MEWLDALSLLLIISSGLAIAAFVTTRRLARDLDVLRQRLDASIQFATRLAAQSTIPSAAVGEPVATPPPAPVLAEIVPDTVAQPAVAAQAAAAPRRESIEEKLASRWMLWLGAVTLAFGGVFLVKYVVDQGWFGPEARCAGAFLFGAALVAGGEWVRRRPLQAAAGMIRPNLVPPALTAAGVSIAFTSAYAAFELYALLPPMLAFIVLGLLAMAAVFLALLQGPLVALLGIVGGFVTPALVSTDSPSAWGLFIYLLFIIASAFAIVRFTAVWWVGQVALGGAFVWLALWTATAWAPGDAGAIGTFLIALLGLVVALPIPRLLSPEAPQIRTAGPGWWTLWLTAGVVVLFAFVLLRMDAYGAGSLVTLPLVAGQCFAIGFRVALFNRLPILAEALIVASMALWHQPRIVDSDAAITAWRPPQSETLPGGHEVIALLPPEFAYFLTVTGAFAVACAGVGFAALWRARRPPIWAALAASTPVLLLAVAYWRIEALAVNFSWALVALILAGLNVAAAARFQTRRAQPDFVLCLAAFAAAAVAALALGATMALEDAWLTVALSLELPALAWIGHRLGVRALRPIAMVIAAVVLVRLVLNYNILDYPVGDLPILNWILYGYGIPCLAFFAASVWFRRDGDDGLVMGLQAGALIFGVLLVTFEIHDCIAGGLTEPLEGLLDPSLRTLAWLAIAVGLARERLGASRRVAIWGRSILVAASVAQIIIWPLMLVNPLWSSDSVGTLPLLNLLLLAYGVPAGLLLLFGRWAIRRRSLLMASRLFSLGLIVVNVLLEVRHGFQGGVLSGSGLSDMEWYAYSLALLGLAGVLLVLGIRGGSAELRYGSLGLLLIVVGKVFLSDMGDLTGLYRAASFLALGLSLIGVGYVYQRFVLPKSG